MTPHTHYFYLIEIVIASKILQVNCCDLTIARTGYVRHCNSLVSFHEMLETSYEKLITIEKCHLLKMYVMGLT